MGSLPKDSNSLFIVLLFDGMHPILMMFQKGNVTLFSNDY